MGIWNWGKSSHQAENSSFEQYRKHAEEPRFTQVIFASLKSPVVLTDLNYRITYANDAARSMFQSLQELLLKQNPQFVVFNHIGEALSRFFPMELPQNLSSKAAGESRVVSVAQKVYKLQIAPFYAESGDAIGYLVECNETSERLTEHGIHQAILAQKPLLELDPSGNIISFNAKFTEMTGYAEQDLQGKAYHCFFTESFQQQAAQKAFWQGLIKEKYASYECQCTSKLNQQLWFMLDFMPIKDEDDRLSKVVLQLTDITNDKLAKINSEGQLTAIGLTQAVIEFTLDGTILTANPNFLATVGYSLEEIKGKHHRMFVDEAYNLSEEYRDFWQNLKAGKFFTGEYRRIGKGGKEIWIQASYNPIFDSNGKPFKVVKYATNITGRKTVVNEIKRVMMELSNGNLTAQIEQQFDGEFSELGEAISGFINQLHHTIGEINLAVETINVASTEISQGNTDLSSRTEQQASSLEETASSMEELTSTVRQNAENAKQANSLAGKATDVALEGGNLIEQVVVTMASINESAQKISDIIGVIDGIAFQTNILALNAAVEAARAGEQGRGFAVVASEVRMLAQRSANAAKDIKGLISESVTKINSCNSLVTKSGNTMQEIVRSIKRVNDLMSEIAAASAEQSAGLDEVGKAVVQMDEMTQQNAALVEEAAAAAESLLMQAEQLAKNIAHFNLGLTTNRTIDVAVTKTEYAIGRKPMISSNLLANKTKDNFAVKAIAKKRS